MTPNCRPLGFCAASAAASRAAAAASALACTKRCMVDLSAKSMSPSRGSVIGMRQLILAYTLPAQAEGQKRGRGGEGGRGGKDRQGREGQVAR